MLKKNLFKTINPFNKKEIAKISQGTVADIKKSVEAARSGLEKWQSIGPFQRSKYLYAIARYIQKESRTISVLESMENGKSIPFSLSNLQDRGKFFVDPNEDIYEGQVIGEHTRSSDLTVNVTKTKKLTNMRSSGSDDKVRIAPAIKFSLEEALEFIQSDEYVEVTPKEIRLRKILLKEVERKRMK